MSKGVFLDPVRLTAASITLVQGVIWSILSLLAILTHLQGLKCYAGETLLDEFTFLLCAIYFENSTDIGLILNPNALDACMWVYFIASVLWVCTSGSILIRRRLKNGLKIPTLVWLGLTYSICLYDFVIFVLFAIDFNTLNLKKSEWNIFGVSAFMMTLAARGFILWIFNLTAAILITKLLYNSQKHNKLMTESLNHFGNPYGTNVYDDDKYSNEENPVDAAFNNIGYDSESEASEKRLPWFSKFTFSKKNTDEIRATKDSWSSFNEEPQYDNMNKQFAPQNKYDTNPYNEQQAHPNENQFITPKGVYPKKTLSQTTRSGFGRQQQQEPRPYTINRAYEYNEFRPSQEVMKYGRSMPDLTKVHDQQPIFNNLQSTNKNWDQVQSQPKYPQQSAFQENRPVQNQPSHQPQDRYKNNTTRNVMLSNNYVKQLRSASPEPDYSPDFKRKNATNRHISAIPPPPPLPSPAQYKMQSQYGPIVR